MRGRKRVGVNHERTREGEMTGVGAGAGETGAGVAGETDILNNSKRKKYSCVYLLL